MKRPSALLSACLPACLPFLPFALVLASFFVAPHIPHVSAAGHPEGEEQRMQALRASVAQKILRLSGEESPSNMRRNTVEDWLARAARNTGETPESIAAACVRNVRYLFDAGKVPATPVELLEALNAYSSSAEPLNGTLHRYVAARLGAPDKSHDAAMRTLSEKRGPAVW